MPTTAIGTAGGSALNSTVTAASQQRQVAQVVLGGTGNLNVDTQQRQVAQVVLGAEALANIDSAVPPIIYVPDAASLALSSSPSTIDTEYAPGEADLALSPETPSVSFVSTLVADDFIADSPVLDTLPAFLPIMEFAPASASDLALMATSPSLATNYGYVPDAASLTLSSDPPAIDTRYELMPDAGVLVVTTEAPTVGIASGIAPDAADLILSASTPTISGAGAITPDTASLALSADPPTVQLLYVVSPDASSLALSADSPNVITQTTVQPDASSIALTANTPNILVGLTFTAPAASLAFATSDPTLTTLLLDQPDAGAMALSADAPTLSIGSIVAVPSASLALAVEAPSISVNGYGYYVITGAPADMFTTGAPIPVPIQRPIQSVGGGVGTRMGGRPRSDKPGHHVLACETGAYAAAGAEAQLAHHRRLSRQSQATDYLLTGMGAGRSHYKMFRPATRGWAQKKDASQSTVKRARRPKTVSVVPAEVHYYYRHVISQGGEALALTGGNPGVTIERRGYAPRMTIRGGQLEIAFSRPSAQVKRVDWIKYDNDFLLMVA